MKTIETLSSIEGRKLLGQIFKELRFNKQQSALSTLHQCWKICVSEKEIFRFIKADITVAHNLGFFAGTSLWMQEIVNRYYYSAINSFVYFGAAILLVLIGLRQFSDQVSNEVVIGGVAFEALMLMFMFVVMLFAPNEDDNSPLDSDEDGEGIEDLIMEVGEIGRDFAAVVVQLENMSNTQKDLLNQQALLIKVVSNLAEGIHQSCSPNPKMLEAMNDTNEELHKFKDTVADLNQSTERLRKEEVKAAVRKEFEKLISNKINGLNQ
jgi:hypothetical protein